MSLFEVEALLSLYLLELLMNGGALRQFPDNVE